MAGTAPGARTEQLFQRHARQVYWFCLYRLGDRLEAEDAVQSTFLNAFRAFERGVIPFAETPWLYKIAHNVCLTRLRSASRRRRVELVAPVDEALASPDHDGTQLLDLAGALRGLPPRQRQALLLREWQGLAYSEIADELGLSRSAVEMLLHRARRTLRTAA